MMNVSKQILFFLIFFIQPLFAPLILQTADEHSQLGWQAYKDRKIELAIIHFKAGMIAKNSDTDETQLKYSRGYCGYGYCKLISEKIDPNFQKLDEITDSILSAYALVLEIPLDKEQDESKRYKIKKMQESATKNIKKLDMVKKLVILKESNPCFKTMEILD